MRTLKPKPSWAGGRADLRLPKGDGTLPGLQLLWQGDFGETLRQYLVKLKLKIRISYSQKFHPYICTLGDVHREGHGNGNVVYNKK